MKAIHNAIGQDAMTKVTVFNTSKIQNESNSQQMDILQNDITHCFQYFKDTK